MANQAIENLTIENFKCFKHLEVNNIGRVNLIGGKNNVGKTAFLEAVELFISSSHTNRAGLIYLAYGIFKRRQDVNQIKYFDIDFIFDNELEITMSSIYKDKTIDCRKLKLNYINEDEYINFISFDKDKSVDSNTPWKYIKESIDKFEITHEMKNDLIYICPSKINEQDIALSYSSLIERGMEDFLNNSLSLFDDSILALKQIATQQGVILKLKIKDKEKLALLSSLGEGINRYIAILCAIWASKDSVLLIDEIENGIHYTNYKKLWQIIFQASIDANCQLFITTHSKECISSFNEVQFENENCNAQYFEFYKNLKTDLIKASAITKERLQYSLTHEGRIRGE